MELADIVTRRKQGREDAEQITLFKSNGIGIWDLAMAELVYKRAMELGMGRGTPINPAPGRSAQ
jgi:ornithine cyclodeaminase/alanine dehydrogenase-like protein (mu-crystallin family)